MLYRCFARFSVTNHVTKHRGNTRAGKLGYLLNREGRYFARLVIPKELRPYMDQKTELRSPLAFQVLTEAYPELTR